MCFQEVFVAEAKSHGAVAATCGTNCALKVIGAQVPKPCCWYPYFARLTPEERAGYSRHA